MATFDFLSSTNPETGQQQLDPNYIMMLAQIAQDVAQGKEAGEVLGGAASNFTRSRANQQAASGMFNNLQVTPKGQAGPDSITRKQTAEGTTTTIQEPSARQLNTFGTTVPPETVSAGPVTNGPMQGAGQAGGSSPFWEALLQQKLARRQ